LIPIAVVAAFLFPWPAIDHGSIKQNDSAAIGKLRLINEAEKQQAAHSTDATFACNLPDLSEPVEYSGYKFSLSCAGKNSHYEASGEPIKMKMTGLHAYCTTEAGVIYWDENGSADRCLRDKRPFDFRMR
jgi:hypothetical protein